MPCCKCNRTGSCKGCACVKAGKPYANCLPSKLGSCTNSSSTQKPSTASAQINTPPATVGPPTTTAASTIVSATTSYARYLHGDEGGILHLEDHMDSSTPKSLTVRDVLISKHPTGQSAHVSCILQSPPTAASIPEICPPHIWRQPEASWMSGFTIA